MYLVCNKRWKTESAQRKEHLSFNYTSRDDDDDHVDGYYDDDKYVNDYDGVDDDFDDGTDDNDYDHCPSDMAIALLCLHNGLPPYGPYRHL